MTYLYILSTNNTKHLLISSYIKNINNYKFKYIYAFDNVLTGVDTYIIYKNNEPQCRFYENIYYIVMTYKNNIYEIKRDVLFDLYTEIAKEKKGDFVINYNIDGSVKYFYLTNTKYNNGQLRAMKLGKEISGSEFFKLVNDYKNENAISQKDEIMIVSKFISLFFLDSNYQLKDYKITEKIKRYENKDYIIVVYTLRSIDKKHGYIFKFIFYNNGVVRFIN